MKRLFFFTLLFPPALMNLLLVAMQPSDLTRYFLAGYLIAAFPAAAIALVDEMMERATVPARATWCGLAGFVLSPIAMGLFGSAGVWQSAQVACCGGVVAFLCAVAFAKLNQTASPAPGSATA
jgi:hypothetical protein